MARLGQRGLDPVVECSGCGRGSTPNSSLSRRQRWYCARAADRWPVRASASMSRVMRFLATRPAPAGAVSPTPGRSGLVEMQLRERMERAAPAREQRARGQHPLLERRASRTKNPARKSLHRGHRYPAGPRAAPGRGRVRCAAPARRPRHRGCRGRGVQSHIVTRMSRCASRLRRRLARPGVDCCAHPPGSSPHSRAARSSRRWAGRSRPDRPAARDFADMNAGTAAWSRLMRKPPKRRISRSGAIGLPSKRSPNGSQL